jgi:hypothetical protein
MSIKEAGGRNRWVVEGKTGSQGKKRVVKSKTGGRQQKQVVDSKSGWSTDEPGVK